MIVDTLMQVAGGFIGAGLGAVIFFPDVCMDELRRFLASWRK